jgi:hypothetical protein
MADDLGREPIAGIAGASEYRHPTRLLTLTRRRKCSAGHQVDVPDIMLSQGEGAAKPGPSLRYFMISSLEKLTYYD